MKELDPSSLGAVSFFQEYLSTKIIALPERSHALKIAVETCMCIKSSQTSKILYPRLPNILFLVYKSLFRVHVFRAIIPEK